MLENYLNELDNQTKYWVVLTLANKLTSKQWVYDSKPNVISILASMTKQSFFVVHKKYDWIVYFDLDKENQEYSLFKSGKASTPFG